MPRSAYDNDPWARGMQRRSGEIDADLRGIERDQAARERAARERPYTGTQFYGRNYADPLDPETQARLDMMSQPVSNGAAEFDYDSPRMRNLRAGRSRDAAKKAKSEAPPLLPVPAARAPKAAPYRTARNQVNWSQVGQSAAPPARPPAASALSGNSAFTTNINDTIFGAIANSGDQATAPTGILNVGSGANSAVQAARDRFPGAFQGGAPAAPAPAPAFNPLDMLNVSGGVNAAVQAARGMLPGAFQGQAGAQGDAGPLGAAFGGAQGGGYTSNANAERAARLQARGYTDDQIERMMYPERFADLRQAAAANVASRGKFNNKTKVSYNGKPAK